MPWRSTFGSVERSHTAALSGQLILHRRVAIDAIEIHGVRARPALDSARWLRFAAAPGEYMHMAPCASLGVAAALLRAARAIACRVEWLGGAINTRSVFLIPLLLCFQFHAPSYRSRTQRFSLLSVDRSQRRNIFPAWFKAKWPAATYYLLSDTYRQLCSSNLLLWRCSEFMMIDVLVYTCSLGIFFYLCGIF